MKNINLYEAEANRILQVLVWLSDDIPHSKKDRELLSEFASEALELMRNASRRSEVKK